MHNYKLLINNELVESVSRKKIEVRNPYNDEIVGYVSEGNEEDAKKCLNAAKEAQINWAKLPAQRRAEYLIELADLIEENKQTLAEILTSEHGKPLHEAVGEVEGAKGFLTYAAESARRIEGEILTSENVNEQTWIQRVPYGVTVGIIAWNFPLALATRKLGNALVTGNTMIIKPPSETPLTVMKLGELIAKSSLPKGVVNILTGDGPIVGGALIKNDITKLVTLTGSTRAGLEVFKSAAENCVEVRLELGGKAPFIVMEDADIEKAVESAVVSRFTNCGQICTCNERMYIHEKIYDEFKEKLIQKTKQLQVGNPTDVNTNIGPKVSMSEVTKIKGMVDKGIKEGAKIILDMTLDKKPTNEGYWIYPMIIEVSNNKNILMQEEIFGPVLPIMKIKSFEQAIQYANDSQYGLSAYLFTNNAKNIMRSINELEFGEVYINRENGELRNAFHNGFKLSGTGGEDGKHGLEGYMQKKTVYMNYNY